MKTLRIIVVRNNDNIVEQQSGFYNLEVASTDCYSEPMKVIGNEKKRIYLFANEATEIKTTGFFPKRKLVEVILRKFSPEAYSLRIIYIQSDHSVSSNME